MNGGEVLIETLQVHGVDTVFFVPGGTFVTALEALSRRVNKIRAVATRLESSATFAADAYAAIRGRPACVFVSRGPGASNAAIGVHTAMQASRPMVLFVANIPRPLKQREAFQELDYQSMYTSIAKAVFDVNSFDEVSPVTARALELARSGRPGPVVVSVSKDVLDGRTGEAPIVGPSAAVRLGPDTRAIACAAKLIESAEHPVIVAGEMVRFEACYGELERFAEHIGAGVFGAHLLPDVIDRDHPGYFGQLSLNRIGFQKRALDEADLVISVGSRLDSVTSADYTMFDGGPPLIMIYPEPREFAQWQSAVSIASHCAPALDALRESIHAVSDKNRLAWRDQLHAEQVSFATAATADVSGLLNLATVIHTFAESVPDDTIVSADAGTFARWIHRYYPFTKPATSLGPVSGAMGYGIPGAIGAALADPDRAVFAWVGDGGFLMTGNELAVVVQENLPIKVFVCDNAAWGSILVHQQKRFPDWDFGTRLRSPDFAMLAKGFGIPGFTVERTEEFGEALQRMLAVQGPALMHLKLDARDVSPFSGSER